MSEAGAVCGLAEDAWLAAALGRPAYVVADGTPEDLPAGFVYAKVPVEDVDRARTLQTVGFYLVDTNVMLERAPAPASRMESPVRVDVARPEQAGELLEIAGSCFRYSRFHLDPEFSRADADRVKREWVRSYVEGRRGVELLAASFDGVAAGFLAVLDAGDARVLDLVGVRTELQGRGVGNALVGAFVERHGDVPLRVGTQIANVPSLRLYVAHDFVPVSSSYVFHRHA